MDELELEKIKTLYRAAVNILNFTSEIKTAEELLENLLIWDAVKMNLVLIAEMDTKISPEIKELYNTVDWYKIKENKSHIISKFIGFDVHAVWKAILEKLPEFKNQLGQIIKE